MRISIVPNNHPQNNIDKNFFNACRDADLGTVEALLKNEKLNVNTLFLVEVTFQGETAQRNRSPLMMACAMGHSKVVELLLKEPRVDVNLMNAVGGTAFYIACQEGKEEIVQQLLEDRRIDVNKALQDGATSFFIACERGHTEIISTLLTHEKVDVNASLQNGITPLHIACTKGYTEIIAKLLADPRIDVNRARHDGVTSLYDACYNGHLESVLTLLSDPQIEVNKTINGATPFYVACERGHTEVVKTLLTDKRVDVTMVFADCTPFYRACLNSQHSVIQQFVQEMLKQRPELYEKSDFEIASEIMAFFDPDNRPLLFRDNTQKVFLSLLPSPPLAFSTIITNAKKEMRLPFAAEYLLLSVLVSDNYFRTKNIKNNSTRFFTIMAKLPLDLQMTLCNLLFNNPKKIISTSYFEPAYQKFKTMDKLHNQLLKKLNALLNEYFPEMRNDNIPEGVILLKKLAANNCSLTEMVNAAKERHSTSSFIQRSYEWIRGRDKKVADIYNVLASIEVDKVASLKEALLKIDNLLPQMDTQNASPKQHRKLDL